MKDMDQQLDKASADVKESVRTVRQPDTARLARRSGRRTWLVAGGVALFLAVGGVIFISVVEAGGPVAAEGDESAITSAEILSDGVVTEAEYTAGAEAVVACLVAAGYQAEFNLDPQTGHAGFSIDHADSARESVLVASELCREDHLSYNVSFGRMAALGQIDLAAEQDEILATFSCVETSTGLEFGDVTYDEFGFRTDQGQQSYEAAFEHQDHEIWNACQFELGYTADEQAETEALFECVESKSGLDFGEITWDEVGHLTEEGRAAENAAVHYEDHATWEACQTELGYWPYGFGQVTDLPSDD